MARAAPADTDSMPPLHRRRLDRDRRELEVLHRIAVTLSQSLSLRDVLTALTRELVFAIDRADECAISQWHEKQDTLVDAAAWTKQGPPAWPRGQEVNALDEYPETRELLELGRGYREFRVTDPDILPGDLDVLEYWGWRSSIELPLVIEGRSVGLIEVADRHSARSWSERDITFVQTIASQAAMAVRNARLYEDLQRRADRDPLTDLLNHRSFYDRLSQELARSHRVGSTIAVIAIDLDEFKAINDRQGHLAGDRALCNAAAAILGTCRICDVGGRLGGDEFAVILPDIGMEVELVARRLLEVLASQAGLAASAGVAVSAPGELDPLTLMARADTSLLDAKRSGKRTFRLSA
jgi:diguanylate cyclase (GGDEF)-like protein